jgi:hypothetical protein
LKSTLSKYCLIALAFLCTLAFATNVYAEPEAPETKGFQAGGFVLHPGADLALAADINNMEGRDMKDGLIDIGAHLRTELLDDSVYSWDNNIALKWRQFWGVGKNSDADGGINVRVTTVADLFKNRFFRLSPSAGYVYVTEPEDENLRMDYKNHNVTGGTSFIIQPGAGAIFSERISYFFNGRLYEDHSDISNFVHRIESVTRWNFLPNTSMSLTIDFRITHYLEDVRGASAETGGAMENSSSYPIRLKYSLQGLMLSRLSYNLGLGYSYVHYSNNLNEHMFIMNARLRYDFFERAGIYVEYRKDYDNVIYGDYYKFHRISAGFEGLWFNRLQTGIEFGYGNFDFRSIEAAPRSDNLITGQARINYFFFPGLKLGAEYRLRYNTSDYDGAGYNKHMFLLNVGYEY